MLEAVLNFWVEPFGFAFMRRAFAMAVVIALVCAIFSCLLVLKGWSLLGDAVAHAVLPGLGMALLLGIPLVLGAFIAGLLCSLGIGYIKDNSRVKEDAVMGIVFSGMFAVGLILVAKIESDVHLLHILFGNVLGISNADLLESSAIAAFASVAMLVKRRDIVMYCFDPVQAQVVGLRVKLVHFGLLALLALTIVSALKAVGIILVVAMLIAPGAIGFLLAQSFDKMLVIAIVAAVSSSFLGVFLSYHLDTASAPTIVVLQSLLFLMALVKHKVGARARRDAHLKPSPAPQ